MIRVLHVLDKISVDSGASAVAMNYYKRLDHEKLTFDFMLNEDLDPKTRAYIEKNGSKIYIMPSLKARNLIKYVKALRAFFEDHDYKIVHGHIANSAVFYLGLAKNVPYRIIHSHNTKASDVYWKRFRNRVLTRFIKRVANRYFACSSEAAGFLFGKNADAVILNNAINVEAHSFDQNKRDAIRAELRLEGKLVIGHVGRFCVQKNHEFLLEVFSGVYSKNSNAALVLIGDGELYQDTVKKAENLGLKDAVLFLGVRDDVGDYMNAMDIFVLPSLFEGLPLVAVEAQASGLRVCLSDKVSRDANITGDAVFLPLDKAAWVGSILEAKMQDRAESSQKIRGSPFDIETQAKTLVGYYENLPGVV